MDRHKLSCGHTDEHANDITERLFVNRTHTDIIVVVEFTVFYCCIPPNNRVSYLVFPLTSQMTAHHLLDCVLKLTDTGVSCG